MSRTKAEKKIDDLFSLIASGEDGTRQFKVDVRNGDSLASDMAAFANSEGGMVFIGVADDGSIPGLSQEDVVRINQLISNTASQHVRSALAVQTENVLLPNGSIVIVLTIPKGLDKPYFDKNGVIWLKCGADKRRINSKEELRRLFQLSNQFHADELPTKAGIDKLDKLRFRDFLRDTYKLDYPDVPAELIRLLQNMNLATDEGFLSLAGVLLFAERPEWIMPQFVIKAIRYPGNEIHVSDYVDTEDFSGPLRKVFDDSLAFVMRNLHKVQAGRGVNAPGVSEIPESVFEELLVNALVHRDYLVSAPIRLFIFDNRIEIISPGHLPNNLTVEKIRAGNSNIRNPILVSFVAKGLLPYHGLGSGIKRALEDWQDIDFTDDREGCMFTATIRRKALEAPASPKGSLESSGISSGISSGKTGEQIMRLLSGRPEMTIPELAKVLSISTRAVEKQVAKLRSEGRLRRIGPAKGGRWEARREE
ncbi:MAG: putative DNA binding domain-containing protein [Alphaproteobacteria bacterium]|uniref:DNA binding domain-containing protein n=1 Tax=Candidatus Nitrobium versatile TaxID=2884831 RepID=A0A953JD97_9BACT|nr:putative DNA binding domain-containing protein [Candidatus Nitrobium versatile]